MIRWFLGFCLIFLVADYALSEAAPGSCLTAKVLSGSTCDSLQVEFGFSECNWAGTPTTTVRTSKCWNSKAVAQVKVGSQRHVATFIENGNGWTIGGPLRVDTIESLNRESIKKSFSSISKLQKAPARQSPMRVQKKPALQPL